MTTSKVMTQSNISNLLFSKTNASNNKGNSTFDDIMNNSINDNSRINTKNDSNNDRSKVRETEVISKSEKSDNSSDIVNDAKEEVNNSIDDTYDDSNDISKTDDSDKDVKFKDDLKEAVAILKNEIKDILDISEEELENMLSEMGICILNLFDPDMVKEFALVVNGENDFASILTNESLADTLNQLNNMLNNINIEKQLGISTKEINALVDEAVQRLMSNASKESDIMEIEKEVVEVGNDINLQDDIVVQEEKNDNIINLQNTDTDSNFNVKKVEIEANMDETYDKQSQTDSNLLDDDSALNDDNTIEKEQSVKYYETFIDNITKAFTSSEVELINEVARVKDIHDIVNQVIERIKVSIDSNTTTMDIQLNPEHLGKVNLNIVSTDGDVKAKFVVENEIAKEALESQMEILKERFDEQGIKVNSIEVTVGDTGLSNNGNSSFQDDRSSNKKKKNFVDIDAVEETDSKDNVVLEMMRENGNMVDYSA